MVQGQPLSGDPQMVVKQLAHGAVALALFNQSDGPQPIRTVLDAIGLADDNCVTVRDLWQHAETTATGTIDRQVPCHGVAILRMTPDCGAN